MHGGQGNTIAPTHDMSGQAHPSNAVSPQGFPAPHRCATIGSPNVSCPKVTAMNKVDPALLNILIKDGRASFADIARQLGISRAHARTRVQALVDSGVIELFSAVVNPEKLGKVISTFIDLKVAPHAMNSLPQELADCPEVVSLYIMSDLQSLHIHTLTDSYESFDRFVRERIFNRPEILAAECKSLLTRVKNRRGGARL